MSGIKTDYFGTFLDTVHRGTQQDPFAPNQPADLHDQIVRKLGTAQGPTAMSDLLAPPATLGTLMQALRELQQFGLVEITGDAVNLTSTGHGMAAKLNSMA